MRGLPYDVKVLLEKARETALLEVETYNRPTASFRSGAYVVLMIIAWTSLCHAMFLLKGIKPYYRNPGSRRYDRIDGEPRRWELKECLHQHYKANNPAARRNLEFFIGLRNKIEHRSLAQINPEVFGECQAMLLNFESLLVSEFGDRYAIRGGLTFALQFSQAIPKSLSAPAAKATGGAFRAIKQYVDAFRSGLSADVQNDLAYSFKVFLVPKIGNHASKDSVAVEWIHLICRPRADDAGVGDWADVLRELPNRVGGWMERLQGEGVRGADLVFACIGPALEIFSRYAKVETAEGREVALAEYLEKVWEVVGRSALAQVLGTAEAKARNGAAGAVEEDARLTALFLWTLQSTDGETADDANDEGEGEDEEPSDDDDDEEGSSRGKAKGFTLVFDVVRRFAQPLGIELPKWEGRVIETKKGVVRLLPIAERAKQLFGEDGAQAERLWFQDLVAPDEVAFESGVFLLRKSTAHALKTGGPATPSPPPEPEPGPTTTTSFSPPSEPSPTAAPGATTKTVRLLGSVPPEVWNRLGTRILPKLRSGAELKIGVEFVVTVKADAAMGLASELRQILQELGLSESVRVE